MNASYSLGEYNGAALSLSDSERRRHLYVAGKTGTGKSTLLFNLMRSDIAAGRGFALIDPHGDLAQSIINEIPPERINDAIYLDPLDETHAIGFNPLEQVPESQRSLAAASIVSALKHIWSASWGPRMEYILGNSVRLLLDVPGATLLHLPILLANERVRRKYLTYSTDPFISYFWHAEFSAYSERFRLEAIAPVQNKVGQFAANPNLRAIMGQRSTVDIDAVMNGEKFFVANLPKQMGNEPSHLLGALLITAFSQAAERRVTVPESERLDFTLYVDEFQNFATESFATILSEARKWRLNLVLANQFLGQLPDTLRQAVLGNIGTLMVFRVGSEDAELLSAELGLKASGPLTDTPNFEAWVKRVRNNFPGEPMLVKTFFPDTNGNQYCDRVINRTRSRHATPRKKVEQKIAKLFRVP